MIVQRGSADVARASGGNGPKFAVKDIRKESPREQHGRDRPARLTVLPG